MSLYGDMRDPASNDDRIWRALADPVRRALLDALATGPKITADLVDGEGRLCRTAVMKHLDVLVAAGLVVVRREGRWRWNYLNPVPIDRICRRWLNKHQRRMGSALNRLKEVVEAGPHPVAKRKADKGTRTEKAKR